MDEYTYLKKTGLEKDFIQCGRWFVNKNGVVKKQPSQVAAIRPAPRRYTN
jgi:hypothetical protein